MRNCILLAAIGMSAVACAPSATDSDATETIETAQHHWTFDEAVLFPADRTLQRAEDGVVLADGTLLVADQRHGLVALAPDGSHRPYGDFAAAGYRYEPPAMNAGPNGVAFTPDRKHVLVADIFTGAIYGTSVETETTELIYQHEFGANTVEADSTGAIWFTQSTENNVVIDEARGQIYVAETMGDRINAFKASFETGELSERRVLAEVMTPDNIELDGDGMVWAASPFGNAIFVINPDTGETYSAFHPQTEAGDAAITEYRRRKEAGEAMLSLVGPDIWEPMPSLVTGIILTPGGGPVYVSGLADTLVKLER